MSKNVKKFSREVKYINKDFSEFRDTLIDYAKYYFPDTYKDFNESSPGMMFIEMASVIGDVLSFYGDVQLQESFLSTVDERKNLYNLGQSHGYKPVPISPSSVELEVMQLVPSIGEGNNTAPDYRYALSLDTNMQLRTTDRNYTYFRTIDPIDFAFSSSLDPTEVSVYSVTPTGTIEYYLLKKKVKAVSGELKSREFIFTNPKIYDKIVIPDENVSHIISVEDSDGNIWHEVPFLAQDVVPISIRNTPYNDPDLAIDRDNSPYILSYKQTEYRFITRIRNDNKIEIQFGSGLSQEADEEIIPNPYNVGLGLDYFNRSVDVSIDPMNFLYTKTYGQSPSNTTLTVNYSVCKGLEDNVPSDTITAISSYSLLSNLNSVDSTVYNTIVNSLSVTNPEPAFGGANKKALETVREEAIANFAAQNRAVTREDYMVRCYNLPAKFGSVAKVYVEQDNQTYSLSDRNRTPNQLALNLYLLGYNSSKNFIPANNTLRYNMKTYLSQFRLMTDAINIKTPYIVNIGINYDIIIRPNYNSNDVLLRCTSMLKEYFENDRMSINQPIMLSKIYTELDKIEGVQTVRKVEVVNLYDSDMGYSNNFYDIETATRDNIIYPSKDPMIFEVKYPSQDIKGRVVDL